MKADGLSQSSLTRMMRNAALSQAKRVIQGTMRATATLGEQKL